MKVMREILIIAGLIFEVSNLFILRKYRDKRSNETGLKVFLCEKAFVIGAVYMARSRKRFAVLSKMSRKRKKKLLEMYEKKQVAEILKSAEYAVPTYISVFLPLILIIGTVSGNRIIIFILIFLLIFLCTYFDFWLNSEIKKRHREIRRDFATLITKLSLLVGAGLTASESFERVSYSNDGLLYMEMRKSVSDMKNGVSVSDALDGLAVRGGCKEIKKFVSLYKQNLEKGGEEFPFILSQMADTAWTEKKNQARLEGEMASQKLLLPIMLMFLGVILMIIIPAFKSFA